MKHLVLRGSEKELRGQKSQGGHPWTKNIFNVSSSKEIIKDPNIRVKIFRMRSCMAHRRLEQKP